MTERMEVDPLRQDTLLNGCRQAMRQRGTFSWWINQRRTELVELLRLAHAQDPELLATLRRNRIVRGALTVLVPQMWRDGREHPDVDSVDVLAELMLSSSPPRLTLGFGRFVSELLSVKNTGAARAECYNLLFERIRPVFGGPLVMDAPREGWVHLLSEAADANLQNRQSDIAYRLAGEAWACRNYLPHGTPETAKMLVNLASLFGSSVGHLETERLNDEIFAEAFAYIANAEESLLTVQNPVELARSVARLGIARSQLWYVRKRRGLLGIIEAEEQRVDVLTTAERAVWQAVDPAAAGDYSRLPAPLRPVVTRLLGDLASAAKLTGDSDLAVRAARDADALSCEPHHRLNLHLTMARACSRIEDRLRCDEAMLRDIDAGALAGLNEWQRQRLLRRLEQECVELVRDLAETQMNTAAWFWERQRLCWAAQGPSTPHTTSGEPIAYVPVPAAPAGTALSWPKNVERCLREQNVEGLVLCLRKAATCVDQPVSVLAEALARVDDWRPPARRAVATRLSPGECTTLEDIEVAALQLAAEFSEAYVTFLGPKVRIALARLERLPVDQRCEWAERAIVLAKRTGRWGHALEAQGILIGFVCDRADVAIEAHIQAFQQIVRQWLVSATGTADLIDVTKELTKRCTRTAAILAAAGYAQPAFDLARSAVGLVGRMISEDPQLAIEFELVERRADAPEEAVDSQLYDLMRYRITGRKPVSIPDVHPMDQIALGYGPDVSFVQLLASVEQGCWALGQSRVGDEVTHWTVRLRLTVAELRELRATVWKHLRPARDGRVNHGLEGLYQDVVRHLESAIRATAEIIFVPQAGFTGLPLQAALGPAGYVIERYRVSYLPNLDGREVERTVRPNGLVAGWDPKIGAGTEAKHLSDWLSQSGLAISRPMKATLGRKMLLDSENQWGVVHVASHGYFFPWPRSMSSRLDLSTKVQVTARDWLRSGCQAQFVFINACSVGRQSLHAGDLNGFPLAIRVRGTVTEVSALAPVPVEVAGQFAWMFYQRWAYEDSLSAYGAACREAIRRGWGPSGWAPYLHSGVPVLLPAKKSHG